MNLEYIYISTITVAELAYGAEKSERKIQNKIALMRFLWRGGDFFVKCFA